MTDAAVSSEVGPRATEVLPLSSPAHHFVRASSAEARARAAAFRREVFLDRRGVIFDERLDAERDLNGHIFLLSDGSTPIATARVLPFPSRLSPLLELGRGLGCEDADAEVGRIAAVRSPGAARASLALLTLGARWLLERSPHRSYIAYCHPKLVELYRLLGAADLGVSCIVPGRADAHRIVAGTFAAAARLGAPFLGQFDGAVQR